MVATETRKLSDLDTFLMEEARKRPEGVRLHQFVLSALNSGFQGRKRGDLTQTINRSLKRLVREGALHKAETEDAVEFVV